MPSPTCSDEDFIATWQKYQSGLQVSKALGVSVRGIMQRRRSIESRYGLRLLAIDRRGDAGPIISEDRAEIKLTVENGVVMVGGDAHYWPGTVPTLHRAFVHLCKKLKPVAAINNGDAFDGSTVSRFPDIGHESKPSVSQEIENLKDRLDEIIKVTPGALHPWKIGRASCRERV